MFDRRAFLSASAATYVFSAPALALQSDVVRPEDFGAIGDGVTNDTDAFAAMSDQINRAGGGTIVLRRTTYIVGRQSPGRQDAYAFVPTKIIDLENLSRPLVIEGNGARLKCAAGLRYGTFDRHSGEPTQRAMPNYDISEIGAPYYAMIRLTGCKAPLTVRNVELDGSLPELRIGGTYGDTGRQLPAVGLFLRDNTASETVMNVHTHHHGLDGIQIDGVSSRAARSRFQNVVAEYNGRQGLSLVGGTGYDFTSCEFNHTGRSILVSAPAAGVDIEAEGGKTVSDVTFADCKFMNNVGCGMVADMGPSREASFARCTFVGTTAWSAWPNKPLFRFDDCTFVGAIVRAPTEADPRDRARFVRCTFSDDPALSPTGIVYTAPDTGGPIADLNEEGNPVFVGCVFKLIGKGRLPWSIKATYEDCTMSQASPDRAYPRGTYLGRNVITGPVDLYWSRIVGDVIVNGKLVPPYA
jgi:hypothetical protein